jgi:hypothetical protein
VAAGTGGGAVLTVAGPRAAVEVGDPAALDVAVVGGAGRRRRVAVVVGRPAAVEAVGLVVVWARVTGVAATGGAVLGEGEVLPQPIRIKARDASPVAGPERARIGLWCGGERAGEPGSRGDRLGQ